MSNFNFLGNFLGKKINPSKDGHDMSNVEALSQNFASITPLKMLYCVPDEHYKVKVGGYIQTSPMREDNFAEIYSNMKAVYVPLDAIWRDYLSLTQSSRDTRKDMLFNFDQLFPVFPIHDVLRFMATLYLINKSFAAFIDLIPNPYDVCFRIIHEGDISTITKIWYKSTAADIDLEDFSDSESFPYLNLFAHLLVTGTSSANEISFVQLLTDFQKFRSLSGNLIVFDFLRIMDNLGYGNYLPIFEDSCYRFVIDLLNGGDISADEVCTIQYSGIPLQSTFFLTDNWISELPSGLAWADFEESASLLPLFAFQYYVYTCEVSNYRKPLRNVITWDACCRYYSSNGNLPGFTVASGNKISLQIDWSELSSSDYVEYYNNLTNFFVNPSPYIDDLGFTSWFIYLFSLRNPLLEPDLFTTMQDSVVSGSIPTTSTSEVNANLIQTIADTSALYKLRQDLLRSGVRREKQMETMFGVSADNPLLRNCFVLDSSKSAISIQSLINQAETDVAPLGARAARGNGSCGLEFEFDTKGFGFLFFVNSFTCRTFYESFMINRSHQLAPEAWFNWRFNHLGLEAVNSNALNVFGGLFEDNFGFYGEDAVEGFSARDWHLKQEVDKVHGLFTNFPFKDASQRVRNRLDKFVDNNLTRGNAIFGGYLPTVIDQQDTHFQYANDLYFNPFMVNNIFTQMTDGFFHGDFSFDQFRCIYNYQIHKVSPMPKLGLLKLD